METICHDSDEEAARDHSTARAIYLTQALDASSFLEDGGQPEHAQENTGSYEASSHSSKAHDGHTLSNKKRRTCLRWPTPPTGA